MKEVIGGENLREKIKEAVDLLCNATSETLGPVGGNVLIDTSEMVPFITNDGVTIAKNIESNDKVINSILEIIKEASLKTNEIVGDGTTTTLVLLQGLIHEGLSEIEKGTKSIVLKNELMKTLSEVVRKMEMMSRKTTKKDLEKVAITSANSEEIGLIASKVYDKVHSKYSIRLEEGDRDTTYYKIKKGYNIEIDNISSMYFQKDEEIYLNNCLVLVLKGYLDDLEQISEVINEVYINNRNMIIFTEDVNKIVNQQLLSYYLNDDKNIFVVTLPDYASRREMIEEDLSIISGATIKNIDLENIVYSDVGNIDSITINKKELIIKIDENKVSELSKSLKEELENTYDEYEKDFIRERLAKLEYGIATIYVGGITKTEIKEKLMRYEDSLCAIESAKDGIIVGEGITLLEVSENMLVNTTADKIFKKVLSQPFEKIIENLGLDRNLIKKKIVSYNYQKIYNYKKEDFEDIKDTLILDPLKVVVTSLKNATSIAILLLTTNYLVINEKNQVEDRNFKL